MSLKIKKPLFYVDLLKDISSKYDISHHELIDKFDDFKYKNEKTLTDQFNEENDFRTNIKFVKIRGVYDTKK